MKKRNFVIICVALLGLLLICAACGKVGDPQPRQNSRSFVWQEVRVTPVNNCLDIRAAMSGVYGNLHSVRLELDGVSGPDDCPACPFHPSETYVLEDLKQSFNSSTGELHFSYCPRETAPLYRYRLIGINIFDTSQHAISPEGFVSMQQQGQSEQTNSSGQTQEQPQTQQPAEIKNTR